MEKKVFVSKNGPVKMTGKTRVWPVKSAIRPDIVRWPAVICSPDLTTWNNDYSRFWGRTKEKYFICLLVINKPQPNLHSGDSFIHE